MKKAVPSLNIYWYLIPAQARPKFYCKPRKPRTALTTACCLWELPCLCLILMKADIGDSPSPTFFLKSLAGKEMTVKHSSLVFSRRVGLWVFQTIVWLSIQWLKVCDRQTYNMVYTARWTPYKTVKGWNEQRLKTRRKLGETCSSQGNRKGPMGSRTS